MLKAKKYVLPGGLRVILVPMRGAPTATVKVSIEAGSKYESEKYAGLSHFLEHMVFKATKKRPTFRHISHELDEMGAVYNASTGTESTTYYGKVSSKNVLKLIDILADIYINPVFNDKDVDTEKKVVLEEIKMYADKPEHVVSDLFVKTIHGNNPASRPIVGSLETVSKFTNKDLYNYHEKHYVASSTVITIAGGFHEKKVLSALRQHFKVISHSKKHGKKRTTIKHRGKTIAIKEKKTDQVHLVMGVRSFPTTHKEAKIVSMLGAILSHGFSSRLFVKMREELGICYYIDAGNHSSTDHGEFLVASGVNPSRVEEAVSAICGEMKRLKEELVDEKELNRVKSSVVSSFYMGLELSNRVASFFASREMFYHDSKTPEQVVEETQKITAEEIREVAKKIFTNKDLTLAVVGRKINKAKLSKVLDLER